MKRRADRSADSSPTYPFEHELGYVVIWSGIGVAFASFAWLLARLWFPSRVYDPGRWLAVGGALGLVAGVVFVALSQLAYH